MPISDKKKCQTLAGLCAAEAERLKESAARLESYRTAYQNQAVDPSGTPLEGNVTAISNWINNIRAVADAAVADAMIAAKVPTHRNRALEID